MDLRLKWFKGETEPLRFLETLGKIKHILLIVPENPAKMENAIQQFSSGLYTVFNDVQISTFERASFRPTDGNWFGLPHEDYLDNFRQEKIDLVIDLNMKTDRLCTYIAALSGARLRMNISMDKYDHIYNFHIRTDEKLSAEIRLKRILENLKEFKTATPDIMKK